MSTPPHELPFDPDDPNIDPWADDPDAPKEPGWHDNEVTPDASQPEWDLPAFEGIPVEDRPAGSNLLGPAALLDSEIRGEIEFEILCQRTLQRAETLTPPALPSTKIQDRAFTFGAAVFALVAILQFGGRTGGLLILTAIAVLLVHELGHGLAMLILRVRVPRVFSIPWLNTDTSSLTTTPPNRAIVHLAGPILVVVAILALEFATAPAIGEPLFLAIALALGLTAYSLLPHSLLDGGHLCEATMLSRMPWSGTLLRAWFLGLFVMLSVYSGLRGIVVAFAFPGLLLLLDILSTHPATRSRMILSRIFPNLSPDWKAVPKAAQRRLFEIALVLRQGSESAAQLATVVRALHRQASQPCLSVRGTVLALAVYLFGWLMIASTVIHLAQTESRHQQSAQLLARDVLECAKDPGPAAFLNFVPRWKQSHPRTQQLALAHLDDLLQKANIHPGLTTLLNLLRQEAKRDQPVD